MLLLRTIFGSALLIASIALQVAPGAVAPDSQPRRIEVMARKFAFLPSEITLKKGEPVVLVLQSEDVLHGLRFKELNLDTEIHKNHSSELSFTPEKTGTLIGRCSRFCGKGHGEMTLTVHITE